jgi:hypothetical protein
MGQIDEILIKMPRLIHFELELDDPMDVLGGRKWESWARQHLNLDIEESMDILDGNQWKYSVSHLQTFDFRFYLSKIPSAQILHSFQSPFWLEQKRWFVAFDDRQSSRCLFTVPRFAPKSIIYSSDYPSIQCTSPELCLDQYVNTLTLPVLRPLTNDFINVTSLVLERNENLDRNTILPFLQLPNLHSLSFVNLSLLYVLSSELTLNSIRTLNVKTSVSKSRIEQICIIFPQVERLEIMIDDNDTMLSSIDGLKYLSICKFIHSYPSSMGALKREWFQEHSSRLKTNDHFTYRINYNNIHLWMSVE